MTKPEENDPVPELQPTGERYLPEMQGDIEAEHRHRYEIAAAYVAGRAVLDVACGEGYGSAHLAEVALSVVGVDIDPTVIEHARASYRRENLRFQQGDCTSLPLPDASVDVVVSFETIEHHDRHDAMLAEIRRVLRPDGLLIISSPDRGEYSEKPAYDNPYHVKELDRDEFEALLQRHFRKARLLGQRMTYGSLVLGRDDRPLELQGSWCPMYWLALATNADRLPALPRTGLRLAELEDSQLARRYRQRLAEQDVNHQQRIDELVRQLDSRQERIDDLVQRLDAQKAARHAAEQGRAEALALAGQRLASQAAQAHRLHTLGGSIRQLGRSVRQALVRRLRARSERKQILDSGLFDAEWYLKQNPDLEAAGVDPLAHFQRSGGYEGRAPSPDFDTLDYLARHPELLISQEHPLIHYLEHARPSPADSGLASTAASETALFDQLFAEARGRTPDHVPLEETAEPVRSRIRTIAFYLPQFHPIPENDRWWGAGFTEWTNVGKAVPQFEGHYQPRHPGELGYYDLRLPEVQERQVELARTYGIEAFCFHYYWFSGKRLLERPIDQFVDNPNIDFPFCLCWANENWTRRWDGAEQDVLLAQEHHPDDPRRFIEDIAPLLARPNYLRVDGKPLLVVYRVNQMPDARRAADIWRQYAREQGLGELHLVAAQSFDIGDPRPFGFDAAVEFPPHQTFARQIEPELHFFNRDYQGRVLDFREAVRTQLEKPVPDYRRYRTVAPGWDNEARKPGRGNTFHRASPGRYQQWLAGVAREADQQPADHKLVFVNAWNEWAEGAYLEPDRHYGYAYLEATRQVLSRYPRDRVTGRAEPAGVDAPRRRHDTAVILHLFHTDLWDEIAGYLDNLGTGFDLYVTLSEEDAPAAIERRIRSRHPQARITRLPNRGRDIRPFLLTLETIVALGYTAVCKIHSKRSPQREDGDRWRNQFLDALLGSRQRVEAILEAFRRHRNLGLVGPAGHWLAYPDYWGRPGEDSPERQRQLFDHLGIRLGNDEIRFFAGSMFWFRPQSLAGLLEIGPDDFEAEAGQTAGTLAHAIERCVAATAISRGWLVTDTAMLPDIDEPAPVPHYPYADRCPPLAGQRKAGLHRRSGGPPAGLTPTDRLRRKLAAHPRLRATLRPAYQGLARLAARWKRRP